MVEMGEIEIVKVNGALVEDNFRNPCSGVGYHNILISGSCSYFFPRKRVFSYSEVVAFVKPFVKRKS